MIEVIPKIKQEITIDLETSDGRDVNHVLEEICKISHDRLFMASSTTQDLEEKEEDLEYEDVISSLKSTIETLEGGFCQILNLLRD